MARKGGWQEFSSNSASTARPTTGEAGPAGASSPKGQQRVRVQQVPQVPVPVPVPVLPVQQALTQPVWLLQVQAEPSPKWCPDSLQVPASRERKLAQ